MCVKSPFESFNCVLQTRRFPRSLSQAEINLFVVSVCKPGGDSTLCKSERPTPLVQGGSKILEAAVLRRLLPEIESELDLGQYAYRRETGPKLHFSHLYGSPCTEVSFGKHVYLAAVEIDGAFSNAPGSSQIETPVRAGVGPFFFVGTGRVGCRAEFPEPKCSLQRAPSAFAGVRFLRVPLKGEYSSPVLAPAHISH